MQSSRARIGNANWVAYTDICAQPVTPLTEESTQNLFPWLLEGSKEEVHKIHDATGVCSKLLHMFSQVTYFAALLQKVRAAGQANRLGLCRPSLNVISTCPVLVPAVILSGPPGVIVDARN